MCVNDFPSNIRWQCSSRELNCRVLSSDCEFNALTITLPCVEKAVLIYALKLLACSVMCLAQLAGTVFCTATRQWLSSRSSCKALHLHWFRMPRRLYTTTTGSHFSFSFPSRKHTLPCLIVQSSRGNQKEVSVIFECNSIGMLSKNLNVIVLQFL